MVAGGPCWLHVLSAVPILGCGVCVTGSWLLITEVGGWACVVHYVMDFQLMLNVYSVNTCIVLGQYRSSCVQGVYINCGGFLLLKIAVAYHIAGSISLSIARKLFSQIFLLWTVTFEAVFYYTNLVSIPMKFLRYKSLEKFWLYYIYCTVGKITVY